MKRIFAFLLMISLLALPAMAEEDPSVYADYCWKNDAGHSSSGLPTRYRTMLDAFPEDTQTPLPSREGMDADRISGSGQYNAETFAAMIADIRTKTDGPICVFDLRQESHGFADGAAVSRYGKNNWGSLGLSTAQAQEKERGQLDSLVGTVLETKSSHSKPEHGGKDKKTARPKVQDTPAPSVPVEKVMTERELCESQDVLYVRIACTDHVCPTDEQVDEFLTALRSLPEGTWLHFHCAAGVGRTGLFMMMADMLRNPDVPLEDIIRRQVLLGANDPAASAKSEAEESDEKIDLLNRFYKYVQESVSGSVPDSFAGWSAGRSRN